MKYQTITEAANPTKSPYPNDKKPRILHNVSQLRNFAYKGYLSISSFLGP